MGHMLPGLRPSLVTPEHLHPGLHLLHRSQPVIVVVNLGKQLLRRLGFLGPFELVPLESPDFFDPALILLLALSPRPPALIGILPFELLALTKTVPPEGFHLRLPLVLGQLLEMPEPGLLLARSQPIVRLQPALVTFLHLGQVANRSRTQLVLLPFVRRVRSSPFFYLLIQLPLKSLDPLQGGLVVLFKVIELPLEGLPDPPQPFLLLKRAVTKRLESPTGGSNNEPIDRFKLKQRLLKIRAENGEIIVIRFPGVAGQRMDLGQLAEGEFLDSIAQQKKNGGLAPAQAAKLDGLPVSQIGNPGGENLPVNPAPDDPLHLGRKDPEILSRHRSGPGKGSICVNTQIGRTGSLGLKAGAHNLPRQPVPADKFDEGLGGILVGLLPQPAIPDPPGRIA